MKFYRGLLNVGDAPVIHQVHRGFRPMTTVGDGGGRMIEVKDAKPIDPMSAAEIVVLRSMHGSDCLSELKEIGEQKHLSFTAERDRLEHRYGEKRIEQIFGARGVKAALPREIELEEPVEDDDEPMFTETQVADDPEAAAAAA